LFLLPLGEAQSKTIKQSSTTHIDEGQFIFAPTQSTTTYLVNADGSVNHSWPAEEYPGESVYLLDDGSIMRTEKLSLAGGGAGGGVQRIAWDGEVLWDFEYYTSNYLSHHDIEPLPNGHVLMIAWEYKTRNEAIDAGRDPNYLQGNTLKSCHIIEVEPTGPYSGDIVWKWHVWDHLIQDFDPTKDNYGVVEDHPELVDLNFGTVRPDWLHSNSIDYHEYFDQILLSSRNFNEIWVIDHSTTTEEAAGHTGGNSGKGGDILYRWGNPQAYGAGGSNDREFFVQHDARWIEEDCPGEGNIIVFNNGDNRPGGSYTSIDEIVPPVDEFGHYYLEPGSAYGPEEQIWKYDCNFFTSHLGGVQRISNGNTIICDAPAGEFIEVTPEKVIVWNYENPYPSSWRNSVFKFEYHQNGESPSEDPDLDCVGNLEWTDVTAGETVNGSFEVMNIGVIGSQLNWEVITSSIEWGEWTYTPEDGFNLLPDDDPVTVYVSVVSPLEENMEFEGYIRVENQDDPEDYDIVPVYLKTPHSHELSSFFSDIAQKHPILYSIFQFLNS